MKEVQSAKIWHEGPKWFVIISTGAVGETAEREKYGPFQTYKEALDKLNEAS